MKSFMLSLVALVLGFSVAISDAEAAKRLGGGRSAGIQRQVTPPSSTNATPATPMPNQGVAPSAARQPAATPAAQAQPKRSWMGPLAGLAAGLGLAALASHFGFGEELASMMMIGLLVMAVMVVIGMVMRRRAAAQGGLRPAMAGAGAAGAGNGMQYSGSVQDYAAERQTAYVPPAAVEPAAPVANIPADFDAEAFVRNAKVNFIRLQAANDAGNLADIREFTTPEMFAEIKLAIDERSGGAQQTDVVMLNAEVLDVTEEAARYIVSVRFHGMLKEDGGAPQPFDEIWNMVKPRNGNGGWVLGGIQQTH